MLGPQFWQAARMTGFDDIEWMPEGLRLGGWHFRYQHGRPPARGHDLEFTFYKLRPMIEEYQHFFEHRPARVRSMLEVGMWDCGSLAFWLQILQPDRAVGVDLTVRVDSPYFDRFLQETGLTERVATHWEVDQADGARLRALLRKHEDMLDLVIDDASHLYRPTRATFQTVFPLVQPGGLYIIEDWAWEHWPEFAGRGAQWADETAMADFVHELVSFSASDDAVRQVSIYKNFVVVERGEGPLTSPFDIHSRIRTRGSNAMIRQSRKIARKIARRGVSYAKRLRPGRRPVRR
jgi:hypothetical protein